MLNYDDLMLNYGDSMLNYDDFPVESVESVFPLNLKPVRVNTFGSSLAARLDHALPIQGTPVGLRDQFL